MPYLTLPVRAEGPIIDVAIALSSPRIDALKGAGLLFPEPVWVPALIDTGASITAIDESTARTLGLVPSGTVEVRSVTTGYGHQVCIQYDICLAFTKPTLRVMHANMPVIETNLSTRTFKVLIGRDLLSKCLMFYNGEEGTFTLAF